MAKTATDPGYAACPIRNIVDRFGDKWSLLVLYNLHTGGRLRFSEIHRRMTDISQKMLAPKYRRASNTPSRPAANRSCPISSRSSAGRWKISTRSSATATPCKQPDRIYKSRTRNRQAAGFGPSRSPQLSPPHRPPSQMPRQSVPAIVPDRLPFQPRQTHPTNAPGKYARQMRPANAPGKHIQQMHPAAPCPLQIEKVPSGTFSILPFRKHKPRAVPCRSRDKSP